MSERCMREELTAAGIPVIEPEPTKESTVYRFARMIRENCMEHLRSHYDLTWNECIEIADRLERQAKEPA